METFKNFQQSKFSVFSSFFRFLITFKESHPHEPFQNSSLLLIPFSKLSPWDWNDKQNNFIKRRVNCSQ